MKRRETVSVMGLGYIGLPIMVKEHNKKAMVARMGLDNKAIEEADVIVYLVAHKEFQGIRIFSKKVLDICGVMNK